MEVLLFCPGLRGPGYLTAASGNRCCVLLWLAVEASKGPSNPFPGMLGSIIATLVLMFSVLRAVVLGASDRVAAIQSVVMLETWMAF